MGATSGNPHTAAAEDDSGLSATDEETLVLQLVKQDPFQTIAELRDEANRRLSDDEVGWWRVFGILRRNHLLRARSRFRFARGRR
jgi:hypothetical protein